MNEDQEFERIARRVKIKRMVTTIGLSIIIIFVTAFAVYKFTQHLAAKQSDLIVSEMRFSAKVMSPNIRISDRLVTNTRIMGGSVVSHRYKDIDGYHIPWSTRQVNYGITRNEDVSAIVTKTVDDKFIYDTENQTKIPLFYSPSLKKEKTDELQELAQMTGYVGEVAISFKKSMTYEQLLSKLPKNIHADWLWMGTNSDMQVIVYEPKYIGIQTYNGKLTKEDYDDFKSVISGSSEVSVYQKFADDYIDSYPNYKTAKFSGVILTGKTENFKQLENSDWIYASSVGATVKTVPYIKPNY
jgi:hypothetical protein